MLDGQNSAGLGFSANFLPGFTRYQTVTPEDANFVSIPYFPILGAREPRHGRRLRAALPGIKVWTDPSLPTGPTPPTIHFVFVDRSGAGLIVEYVDGELRMHENAAHVLTNAPTYDWHLTNLRNYLDLTAMGVESIRVGSVNVTALGQGGGTIGLPGDSTPPSRFVRAAFLRHYMTRPATADQAIQAVGHVLNTVDLPLGTSQSREDGKVVTDFTQWVGIKDLTHNRLHIADYDHRLTFVTIDLDALFALDAPSSVPVANLPYPKPGDAIRSLGGGRCRAGSQGWAVALAVAGQLDEALSGRGATVADHADRTLPVVRRRSSPVLLVGDSSGSSRSASPADGTSTVQPDG